MKKLLIALGLMIPCILGVFGARVAQAIPDFLGSSEKVSSGIISNTAAFICSIIYSDPAGASTDKVQFLNGNTATSANELTFTGNASQNTNPTACYYFTNGIFLNYDSGSTEIVDVQWTNTI